MAQKLRHRGPDDEGVWCERSSGVSLAHRRLSILDQSEAGHQPMLSHCGRYVLVFNGEIYNHQSIRKDLQGQRGSSGLEGWRGHSDTEVLLSAIACWGLEVALAKAVGMFAFALWDRAEKTLYLVRDRIGEKPLYYGFYKGSLIFASGLTAIRAYPSFQSEIDRDALALFLRHNVVPAPLSILRGIYKLRPGTFLKVTEENVFEGILDTPIPYWSLSELAIASQGNPFKGSVVEACDELERILKRSISEQSFTNLPVGAFLSGGIDSSTVVALMQAQSVTPVKTFTIGFHESAHDEAPHARVVAEHLGTEHHEMYITAEQALAIATRLPKIYDEPFADVSQIPTVLLSELAKQSVAVCLSGDGGDEVFGGYTRYTSGARLWRNFRGLPQIVRAGLAGSIRIFRPSQWDYIYDRCSFMLPKSWRLRAPGYKLHKVAELLNASSPAEIYLRLVSHWFNPERVVIGGKVSSPMPIEQQLAFLMPELEHQMMCMDSLTYLPDDILVKVDRAAMGVSLETRVPMLDHRVLAFAWSLPLCMKIRNQEGKWLLRQVLARYVPDSLLDRPKTGFSVPIDSWLRGPLRDWAEELLNRETLKEQGFFAPEPILEKWKEHLDEKRDWSSQLWSVLMFQAWLKEG